MKIILQLILVLMAFTALQAQQTDTLNYFPHKIGDTWQYDYPEDASTYIYK